MTQPYPPTFKNQHNLWVGLDLVGFGGLAGSLHTPTL